MLVITIRGWFEANRESLDDFVSGYGGELGPTRIRTWNQRIHVAQDFRPGVDYLITLSVLVGCGMLEPVIKGAIALR